MSKQYGLLVPNKSKPLHPMGTIGPSVFGDDSDSDSGACKPTGLKTALKRQDKLLREQALEEDPTIFQYDEHYDDMEAKRKESKLSRKDLDKKPKYISKLLASAERRKRENERRIERQVQKEREAEGEEFKDKESFVTSAYKAKLEELKMLEEQEKREDYLEAIGDVTKQGNLDGFYRHLYDQKVLYEHDDTSGNKLEIKSESGETEKKTHRKRKYRKRDSSESEPEPETDPVDKSMQHLPSNIDADSDFSIDSSDSEEEADFKKPKLPETNTEPTATDKAPEESKLTPEEESKPNDDSPEPETKVVENEKPKEKVDIWKKRTVGEVFDEALRRYFERKALREAGSL